MARQKRAESVTGIYHVMLRGINKQQIFFDFEDYNKFLSVLRICKDTSGFKLHAYCLMSNHIHLLIQEGDEPLEKVFKSVGARFVYWYNLKYKRVGGLFQGRFKSVPVNDDAYYISVLRYIHQNPVKAGMVKDCSDYDFSSYNSYITNVSSIVDKEFTMSLISINEFKRIHSEQVTDYHMDLSETDRIKITDEEALRIIEKYTHCRSEKEFLQLPKDMQNAYISLLKKQHLSIRQICRLTGVKRHFVEKN